MHNGLLKKYYSILKENSELFLDFGVYTLIQAYSAQKDINISNLIVIILLNCINNYPIWNIFAAFFI